MHRVFFGHHKFASRLFRLGVFKLIANNHGWDVVSYKVRSPPFHFSDLPDLDLHNIDFERLRSPEPAVINLLNSSAAVVSAIDAASPDFRGLRVLRDPRQVLVSAYFHHRDGHPTEGGPGWVWDKLAADRPILQKLPVEDGLLYELDNITASVLDDQVLAWRPDSRILEARVEDINIDREAFLVQLKRHLELRSVPDVDWGSTFSDSGAQDWSAHFTPKVTEIFKSRYGQALINMKYAEDFRW
jgi:hypothetical protein